MKKCFAMIIFLFAIIMLHTNISYAASPHWRNVGETYKTIFYIDTNSIIRRKTIIIFMGLTEYKTQREVDGKKYNSATIEKIIDCKRSVGKANYMKAFSGSMGRGDMVMSEKIDEEASPIAPGTIDDIIKDYLCKKF